MEHETVAEDYSFDCGTHTWFVLSAKSMIIDRSVGIRIHDVDLHTAGEVEESALQGQECRLTKGGVVLAQSPILRATFLGLEHGLRSFRVLIQSAGDARPSPRLERPTHGRAATGHGRSWVDVTEKVRKGAYVVDPYDDPLYRQATQPLPRPTKSPGAPVQHRTQPVNCDEMKWLHLVKCRENGSNPSVSPTVDPHQDVGESRLLRELVEVFYDRDRAVFLLLSAGFPRGMMPEFGTPVGFWTRVVDEVHHGVLAGGLATIIRRAAQMYPSNRIFKGREPDVRCG